MSKWYYVGRGAALQVFVPNGKTSLSNPDDPDSYPVQHGSYLTLAAADTSDDELAEFKIPVAEVEASGLWQREPPPGHKDAPPPPAKPEATQTDAQAAGTEGARQLSVALAQRQRTQAGRPPDTEAQP